MHNVTLSPRLAEIAIENLSYALEHVLAEQKLYGPNRNQFWNDAKQEEIDLLKEVLNHIQDQHELD